MRGLGRLGLTLALLLAACAPPDDSSAPASSPEDAPILVEARWQGRSKHHAIWLSGIAEPAGSAWHEFDLDSPDAEAQSWLDRAVAFRQRCYTLSEQAFDRLQQASRQTLPAAEFAATSGRKQHLVLPSPALDRVVILHHEDGRRGIIELGSLHETGWDESLHWGAGHKVTDATVACWSGDGTRLALSEGYGGDLTVSQRILVLDARTGAGLGTWNTGHFVIEVAWSPERRRLAALTADHRQGSGPIESLAAAIGHGRPYMDLFVEVIDLETGAITTTEIAHDLAEASAHLVWDPQAVTARTGWEPD